MEREPRDSHQHGGRARGSRYDPSSGAQLKINCEQPGDRQRERNVRVGGHAKNPFAARVQHLAIKIEVSTTCLRFTPAPNWSARAPSGAANVSSSCLPTAVTT